MRYTAVSWIGKTKGGDHRGVYIVDNVMGLYANSNGTWFKTHLDLLNAGDTPMREALKWSLHNPATLAECNVCIKIDSDLVALSL